MIYSYDQFIALLDYLQDVSRWDKRMDKKYQRSLTSADEEDRWRY